MEENTGGGRNPENSLSIDVAPPEDATSPYLDDDGHQKRTGTLWTVTAHIITAVIGSGVLSLAWAMAQLGWIAGPIVMILFALVTFYASKLLAYCYRTGDPVKGKRNYNYREAVRSNLGVGFEKICGLFQCAELWGVGIGYTVAASISMMAIRRANCYHSTHGEDGCQMNANNYMIGFGIVEIIFSQIQGFDELQWLSILAAIMSFTYSIIGLGLGIAYTIANKKIKGSITGVRVGNGLSGTKKLWRCFQALGNIAFAYSYSLILIEIQDTIKSPPAEYKTMHNATAISVGVTTIFYMMCGMFGYSAFGDNSPGNLLTGFGFYNPYWLLDIANAAIVVHLVGAYQVYYQPLYSFFEKLVSERFPESTFINKEYSFKIPFYGDFKVTLFRLVWRTLFVVLSTVISMMVPFFNDIVGLIGAVGFWPITVFFPVEMYMKQKNIRKWSMSWIGLQALSVSCLVVSLVAAAGSVVGIADGIKGAKLFHYVY